MIEPVRVPTKTDTPSRNASRMAIRNESRGAPTSDAMAMRFAPTAIAMAPLSVPATNPITNTATTGSAVTAPATGLTRDVSKRRELRSATRCDPREISPSNPRLGLFLATLHRDRHDFTLVFRVRCSGVSFEPEVRESSRAAKCVTRRENHVPFRLFEVAFEKSSAACARRLVRRASKI